MLLVSPQKWARGRGEDEFGREGTYLKVIGKNSVLVWNNGKTQSTTLHTTRLFLPEMSINQGHWGITKFYIMLAEFFMESDRVYACPAVATP